MNNLLLMTDSYKVSHRAQYPKGTNKIYSYFTARGSRLDGIDKVVFFGLRYYIEKYLKNGITHDNVDEFVHYMRDHLGSESVEDNFINDLHELADKEYLPLHIKALPEGSEVPMQTPLFTITNTDPKYFWLTNYVETLLCKVWYTCTCATLTLRLKRMADFFANHTCNDNSHVPFSFHDFSFRGISSEESAELAGLCHLLYFNGTDTVGSIPLYKKMFGKHNGYSVPASEHSTATMYGRGDGEFDYLNAMLDAYPKGIVSVVADSYDFFGFLTKVMPALKHRIVNRDGKLVVRPDSSPKTPFEIVMGDYDAPEGSPEYKGALQLLWEEFGGTINSKGYKVLDPHIGLIYGDAISYDMADKILRQMAWRKFASSNIVFGVGAYGRQMISRDSLNFAIKCTYGEVNGNPIEVYKDPATDRKKRSLKGLLYVDNYNGDWITTDKVSHETEKQGALKTVFKDGTITY